jgi:multiple sugar transport system permease protein
LIETKRVAVYVGAVFLAIWSLFPIYWVINQSLMVEVEALSVPSHYWPYAPTLANYIRVLGFEASTPFGVFPPSAFASSIRLGLLNSFLVALPVSLASILIAAPVAYVFSRFQFPRKNAYLLLILSTRALPAISIIVPYYYLFQTLGLHGNLVGLIILHLSIAVPLITWILLGFFATLPYDVERAARIDGLGRLRAFQKVVMPMASSGIAATAILAFLISWNEFLFAWILTMGTPAQTLPPVLPGMLFMIFDHTALYAATVLSIVVPAIIVAVFEKYISQLKIVDPGTIAM